MSEALKNRNPDDDKIGINEINRTEAGEFPPELAEYVPLVENFIQNHKYVLATIARDNSLSFVPGRGFSFRPKEGKITLDVNDWKWANELGLEQDQILWSTLHEVAHFQDMARDPKGMLGQFDYMEKKAVKMAPKVIGIWEKSIGEELPDSYKTKVEIDPEDSSRKMSSVEMFLYQSYHRLYNCIDDVYVNRLVGEHSAPFSETGSKSHLVESLYRDFLFPTRNEEVEDPLTGQKEKRPLTGQPPEEGEAVDYTELPLSNQFVYYLLRKHMVPGQEIKVSEEVLDAIHQQTDKAVKRNVEQEVFAITKPSGKYDKIQHTAGWRYEQIQKYIEPIFTQLLLKDIEKFPPPPPPGPEQPGGPGKPGKPGEGKPGESQPGQESEPKEPKKGEKPENSEGGKKGESAPNPWQPIEKPSPIDRGTVAKFIKEIKEKEKEGKAEKKEGERMEKLTPKERVDKARAEQDKVFCNEHNIDENVMHEYRQFEESVEEYKDELAEVFERIMQSVSKQITLEWEKHFKSGRFNTEDFVEKYGAYLDEDAPPLAFDEINAHEQKEFMEKLKLFPENIRLRLIIDGSGSMGYDGGQRIIEAKRTAVLIMEALAAFEKTLNLRFELSNPFRVDTEVRMFGSPGNSKIIKPFSEKKNYDPEEDRAQRIRSFADINHYYGGTSDDEAWSGVEASLADAKYVEDLKSGKSREFVFEITDGGSDTPTSTSNRIREALNKGIIARGFQIGNPGEDDVRIFSNIWRGNGRRIGNLGDLAPSVAKIIEEEMGSSPFKVVSEEGDIDEE